MGGFRPRVTAGELTTFTSPPENGSLALTDFLTVPNDSFYIINVNLDVTAVDTTGGNPTVIATVNSISTILKMITATGAGLLNFAVGQQYVIAFFAAGTVLQLSSTVVVPGLSSITYTLTVNAQAL